MPRHTQTQTSSHIRHTTPCVHTQPDMQTQASRTYLDEYMPVSNTYTPSQVHTPRPVTKPKQRTAKTHTHPAHNKMPAGGTHKQTLVFAVKEPKPTTAHRCGLPTHTGIFSITRIRHSNPINPDFLLINQGGVAALWGQIDLSN